VDPRIFITYSSKDQKVARTICTALENRGLACWISSRNVKPGQNYQEQIVRAIRGARVMVLVFTTNANNSNEIKKELALASQNNLVVIPVRIEDVAPNEAFAYEFATRQWIDLFEDWEKSMAELVDLIAAILNDASAADRASAAPGPTGDAAAAPAPAFFMAAPAPASATTPAVPFMQQPGTRWAMIAVLAVIVAAAVAYTVVIFALRPSTSVTANVNPPAPVPPPPQPRPAPAPPVPSPPPAPATSASAGALAVALPADVAKSGFSYGYSNNYADAAQAAAHALDACRTTKDAAKDANLRSLCKVVLNYSNQCVAVAMDPEAGTPGVGWAVANDLQSAENQALAKCQETAGPGRRAACVTDHSACDGNAR
jgi:TIR domain-containing protein/uncharacterized protein DUF4189